jgi:hypothetical protein
MFTRRAREIDRAHLHFRRADGLVNAPQYLCLAFQSQDGYEQV